MNTKTEEILKELNKIIVGKEAVLEKTLMAIYVQAKHGILTKHNFL